MVASLMQQISKKNPISRSVIVMIGPDPESKGGIAAVIATYKDQGLFTKWPVIFLPTHIEGSKLEKLVCAFRAMIKFIGLLMQNKVGLLHIHVARRNSFWRKAAFMGVAICTRCPVLIHLHSGGFLAFYQDECGPFKKFLIQYLLKRAAALIVLTKSWACAYKIFEPKYIAIVPNFVTSFPLKHEPSKPTLLFLGRLTQEKGVFDLLHAIALLKPRYPDLIVKMGGEGNIHDIEDALQKFNIQKNIILEGWVEKEQKLAMLSQATIFVLPSYVEGLPMGILEAMSCGLPVIATRVGGIPDIIESEENGILVNAGQPAELARQIDRLLSDVALRDRLSKAGLQTFKARYSAEALFPTLEKLYHEVGFQHRLIP